MGSRCSGPSLEGLQGYVVMVAGASSGTAQGAAVKELMTFLMGPRALPVSEEERDGAWSPCPPDVGSREEGVESREQAP